MIPPPDKRLWDIEVAALTDMLSRGLWSPGDISALRRQIEDRKQQLASGLGSPTQIYWTARLIRELDDLCRVRLDPVHGWMLDRWDTSLLVWHPVGYIGQGGRLDEGRVVEATVRPDLISYLRSRDMRRPGYLREKYKVATDIRTTNEKRGSEMVMAAVDSLSSRQVKEFLDVEKARHTGEKVVHHGPDEVFMDRLLEKEKTMGPEELPTGAINPGHRPDRITRGIHE